MVGLNVEVTQKREEPTNSERPIVIVDSEHNVVRYDLKEARRQGISKTEALAVPSGKEKY
jgi:hypothetical protein